MESSSRSTSSSSDCAESGDDVTEDETTSTNETTGSSGPSDEEVASSPRTPLRSPVRRVYKPMQLKNIEDTSSDTSDDACGVEEKKENHKVKFEQFNAMRSFLYLTKCTNGLFISGMHGVTNKKNKIGSDCK